MKIQNKHLCWGAGITLGLITIGGIVWFVRRKSGNEKTGDKAPIKLSSWVKPIAGVKISSRFGYRINPVSKAHQFHNGVDLPVPINTQVKNPQDGVVSDVFNNKDGGNQLVVKHSDGLVSGFAHLTKALVKKGDKIKKGQVIALSGNTGKSTGPHVHLTIKDAKGNYVDPGIALFT
jgi:murein DD-endopeptidase MepM/ murein hydrolase activator NlpD